jgi:hypothetical protein
MYYDPSKKQKKPSKSKYGNFPTKNFLQNCRNFFLNKIQSVFKTKMDQFEVIRRIKSKPCINKIDYTDLLKVE